MYKDFEYFLNGVFYSLYRGEVWFNKKIDKIVPVIYRWILSLPFTSRLKKKLEQRTNKELRRIEEIKYGKNFGISIGMANHLFVDFYLGYPAIISFLIAGITLKVYEQLNTFPILAISAIPIGLGYIPAYRAVFSNDEYLKYFKQFEKEDEQWHKKWERRTWGFCIGSIIATILGLCSFFLIAIVL